MLSVGPHDDNDHGIRARDKNKSMRPGPIAQYMRRLWTRAPSKSDQQALPPAPPFG